MIQLILSAPQEVQSLRQSIKLALNTHKLKPWVSQIKENQLSVGIKKLANQFIMSSFGNVQEQMIIVKI